MTVALLGEVIDGSNSPYVYVIGDYNADITRNASFSRELNTWFTTHSLEMVDREVLPSDIYIYLCESSTWLSILI